MPAPNWDAITNAFDPYEPVPVELLNGWFVSRPGSPRELLANRLSPKRTPNRHILVGQPASGKTSELKQLARELQERDNSLAVFINLDNVLDIDKATPVEVLLLMGAAVFKVADEEGLRPDRGLLDRLNAGLETIVRTETKNEKFALDMSKLLAGLAVLGGAALAAAVAPPGLAVAAAAAGIVGAREAVSFVQKLNPFRLLSGLDAKVMRKREVEPSVGAMIESLNLLLDDVTARLRGRSLVVLMDGLDKLREPEVIRVNFLDNKYLNGPKCRVVYTGPLDLYYSPELGSVRTAFDIVPFSHVKLRGKDDAAQHHAEGYETMRAVARKRLESLGLALDAVVEPAALELMIRGCGGVMRDFIRLVTNASDFADIAGRDQIGRAEALKALNDLRKQLSAQLTPKYHAILAHVEKTHKRVNGAAETREKCDLMLRNDVILSYFNDDIRFARHPALTPTPWE